MQVNNLKAIRVKKGFTQAQVAKAAEISERGYQNYEMGIRIPNTVRAQKIANVLETSTEELFPVAAGGCCRESLRKMAHRNIKINLQAQPSRL